MVMVESNNVKKLKLKIARALKKYGIKKAGVFGSFVRGEEKASSDIDILVEIPERINLYGVIGIKFELEDVLGRKVDLVEYKSIRPELRKEILGEEVRII